MKSYLVPKSEKRSLSEETYINFFSELVKISNKYRIGLIIKNILELKSEPIQGKLLDVVGYYFDDESRDILPSFIDILSGKEE